MKGVMTEEQNNQDQDNQENNEEGGDSQDENKDNPQEPEVIEEKDPESFDFDQILDDADEDPEEGDDEDKDKKSKPKVNKAVEAINTMRLDGAVKNGISDYFDKNPEAKQFQPMVEKFVKHSERMKHIKNGLPVSAVIAEALAPHQQRLGALKVKAADEEANRSKDGGNGQQPKNPGKSDFSTMSSKEILKIAREVKSGRYKG